MSSTTLVTITHGAVALALIAATTVLLALGHLSESTGIALYMAAITVIGAGTSTALALKVPPQG